MQDFQSFLRDVIFCHSSLPVEKQIGLLFSYISCGKPVKDAMKRDPYKPRMFLPLPLLADFRLTEVLMDRTAMARYPTYYDRNHTKFVLNCLCRYITLPLGTHIFTTASFLASVLFLFHFVQYAPISLLMYRNLAWSTRKKDSHVMGRSFSSYGKDEEEE